MDAEKIITLIFNFLYCEEARLDNVKYEKSKYINPHNITYERAQRFIEADMKHKHFEEFMQKILEILRLYKSGGI